MNIEQYKELNNSYHKKMIFHLGYNAGFFTEYTYMVNAMLDCLDKHICFKLYSDDANFGTGKGWSEFFLPFCEESHEKFHHWFNFHRVPDWDIILTAARKHRSYSFILWKCKFFILGLVAKMYCFLHYKEKTLLTQDVHFDYHKHFYIPELDIDGDYIFAFSQLAQMIWRFNDYTSFIYQKALRDLSLPTSYIGCQIRGGDKITETELVSKDLYLDSVLRMPESCIFILTDDYRNFEALKAKSKNREWKTLCCLDERGYDHKKFVVMDNDYKKQNIVKLFVSVQILMDSSSFIGSITCGPSVFLLKLKYPNGKAIDCSPENMKDVLPLDINHRGVVARDFLKSL